MVSGFWMMAALEAKGYLQAYREVLCFWFAGFIIGSALWLSAGELAARGSLFEPFTAGVVDHDGTPELIFIFDFFSEYVIDLKFMEKDEALESLTQGDIPAFVELPENFTRDVFHGVNSPFTVHLNSGYPLQGNLVQLLASGGIEFLSASQAGVYATLLYAYNSGMNWEQIQRDLLIPVNMAFAQELILYEDMFVREMLPLVEGSPAHYFVIRFAAFWHMLSLLALLKFLPWYPLGVMARFKLAGVSGFEAVTIKWIGLAAAVAVMSAPIVTVAGFRPVVLSAIFVSALGLLSGRLFGKHSGACGLFIFSVALVSYFASGGIVPFVFLPQEILPMRYFSIIYWVAVL